MTEFMKIRSARSAAQALHLFFGISVVPVITLRFLKRIPEQTKRIPLFLFAGVFYFFILSPKPTRRERELIGILEPRYHHLLDGQNTTGEGRLTEGMDGRLAQIPRGQRLPVLPPVYAQGGDPQVEVTHYTQPGAGMYSEQQAPPLNPYRTPSSIYRDQAPAMPASEYSPYIAPVNSSQPYVYGSLSSGAEKTAGRRQ